MALSIVLFLSAILGAVAAVVSLSVEGIDPWTLAWLFWAATFALIEGVAIFNKVPNDTLSEKLRQWGGIKQEKVRSFREWMIYLALILFFIWFPIHILTGVI